MATDSSSKKPLSFRASLIDSPVDIAALAAFRFLFGLMMSLAMVRFIAKGWVGEFYIQPSFYFTYPGFRWLHPWPGGWMHFHFVLLALLACGIALGCFYRICAVLFFVGFTYVELLDQTTYLNHYYLICLLSGLLAILPANRAWSVDAWRNPALRTDTAPAWTLNLLRFQAGVVYFFAGLAKFNADWLFKAEPLRIWLAARSDLPFVGPLLDKAWVAYGASWFGAAFDTSIVFLLLCPRTRKPAYLLAILFHVATWILFNIGMFPWVMLVAATVFFSPDWPRNLLLRINVFFGARSICPSFSQRISAMARRQSSHSASGFRANAAVFLLLVFYAAIQLALPIRSYLVSGTPAWTCTGFNCAWRVMIAEKSGYAEFYAFDPASDRRWKIPTEIYLTPRQEMMMDQDPDLIRQMARRMGDDLKQRGRRAVQINVESFATLNGRPSQRLINPGIDLAGPTTPGWILQLAY
ncbi:MAG TPA: HTTM domain-containing protein [Verrucomicrobiae bacterium]|nr:HTTM domain-containing protein [Verrucomicrobiae bacterium]